MTLSPPQARQRLGGSSKRPEVRADRTVIWSLLTMVTDFRSATHSTSTPETGPAVTPGSRVGALVAGSVMRCGVLITTDLAALVLSAVIAYFAWARLILNQAPTVYLELLPLLPVFIVVYARAGLYPGFGLGAVEVLRRLTLGSSFVFLLLAAFSFIFRVPHHYS